MGTWDHWILWNISSKTGTIEIGEDSVPSAAVQGLNSWGNNLYGGPCPPMGTHRYFFKAYALDKMLDIDVNSDKKILMKEMQGHVLAKGELIGLYKKM
jgi:hypothetical protein